jgi:integrase
MIKENYRSAFSKRLTQFRTLTTEEIQQIIEACDAHLDLHLVRDIVRVVANTGMSNSELSSLLLSDIDFERNCLLAGKDRKSARAGRLLPLRSKTIASLASLHRLNPESPFVLGEFPRRRFTYVVARLRSTFPHLWRGRSVMNSVRRNFMCRLLSAGIPIGVVRYCLAHRDLSWVVRGSPLKSEQRLDIVRRNLERFTEEL